LNNDILPIIVREPYGDILRNTINFKLGIDNFTTQHHNKEVSLTGIVGLANPVTPELITAVFKCEHCGEIIDVMQGGGKTKLLKPEECTNQVCEKKQKRFTFLQDKSIYSDYQEVWMLPLPLPENIKLRLGKGQKIILKEDLAGALEGEKIKITGTLGFELKGRTNFAIPVVFASDLRRID
jgi:DNA replicative helicase MCM subunit Mcm2 (Cdc46/Mcm family)